MTFQKGNTLGNRAGRPPAGKATAELLRAIGDLPYKGTGETYRQRAAKVLWEQACSGQMGSLQALQLILDRTEGKVTDKLETEHSGEVGIRFLPMRAKPSSDTPVEEGET